MANGFCGHIKLPHRPRKTVTFKRMAATPVWVSGNAAFLFFPIVCVCVCGMCGSCCCDQSQFNRHRLKVNLQGAMKADRWELTAFSPTHIKAEANSGGFRGRRALLEATKRLGREEREARLKTGDSQEAEEQKGTESQKRLSLPLHRFKRIQTERNKKSYMMYESFLTKTFRWIFFGPILHSFFKPKWCWLLTCASLGEKPVQKNLIVSFCKYGQRKPYLRFSHPYVYKWY